jgi:hypothetical protein
MGLLQTMTQRGSSLGTDEETGTFQLGAALQLRQ